MYTAGAQHSSSRLSLWRPAPQEKLLLCVNVAGHGWASPEKRSRPAHGWKGRPRSWQRSAHWYQVFCFFRWYQALAVEGPTPQLATKRSLVPGVLFFSLVPGARWYPKLKPRQSFSTLKPRLVEHTHGRIFLLGCIN